MNGTTQNNRLALITGAAQRVGKALTGHLAEKGWNIAVHFNRSEQPAAELVNQLHVKYPQQRFEAFKADLMIHREMENLISSVVDRMGIPELLINNAALFEPSTIAETSPELFDRQLMVNLRVPFFLTRDFAAVCRQGQIINLADTRITNNKTGYAAYSLSKKMLWELTKMSALEFGPAIRVNAIAPGLTLSPAGKEDGYLEKLAIHIPMKRPGGIKPVLQSLDFLLENDYLTGQLIFCDGGQNLM